MSEIQSVDRQLCIKFPASIVISRSVYESGAINFCFDDNFECDNILSTEHTFILEFRSFTLISF